MEHTQIAYELDGPVATIVLDRPDVLNAFTKTMKDEVVDAMDRAEADDEVRAIIVTGRGRAFCAGADLSGGADTFGGGPGPDTETRSEGRDDGGRLTLRIHECRKPVIAAINGPAVGVGITMTLAMDIRLAAAGARISFPFVRRGIVPEACSSWFLTRLVGMGQAQEWVLTGRLFDAEEAKAGGLVRSVHEPDDLLPAAREIAHEIAENAAPVSVALARQMLWRMSGAEHPMEAHRVDSRAMTALGGSRDAHEGVSAFLEKRAPRFTMSAAHDMPAFHPWWEEPAFE